MNMANPKKPKRIWLYVSEEDEQRLSKLVQAIGTLNETSIVSTIAAAGLKACEELGYKLPLPLKFTIKEETTLLNEPIKYKR